MLTLPVLRWGQVYESLEHATLNHFATGEPVARVGQATGMMVQRDMRKAGQARAALLKYSIDELIDMAGKAADYYMNDTLPIGDGTQTPDEFVKAQSATTGLPEHMCRFNMTKNEFVLRNMRTILQCLTRGLDFKTLSAGHGVERDVEISFQNQSPILGMVLPSNSPGVHALWMPVIPMQVGLVMKPGSQEPWTPYRITEAFYKAGVPREAISLYAGPAGDVGGALLNASGRSLIFGGQQTVDIYKSNPRVQAHGPGFSKVIIAEDEVDNWEKYIDLIVTSVCANGGRSCINASAVWVPRHGKAIADALAQRFAKIMPKPVTDPESPLAAFTDLKMAEAINNSIEADLKQSPSATEMTAKYRDGDRLQRHDRYGYILPTVVHCPDPEPAIANREYLFPFASVVECPSERMFDAIGPTLIGTVISNDPAVRRQATDCTHIDRLNLGPIPTVRINWLQPHEGNLFELLFRNRAYQTA